MKKRFLSLAIALAVLCQTALCLAAFGPFSTINNGGATTLKGLGTNPDPLLPNEKWRQGAVVTPVSNLAANTEVFVTSVRDWFRWDPSSTATSDDIAVVSLTANGGSAGRFLREFRADPYWRAQAAWFVDTAGNDENDGSSLAPVKTDVEISRRWGLGVRARLDVDVTITYAQTPVGQTNYIVELLPGIQLTLVGTPTVTKAGTVISAVQAQVRTAGAEAAWAITGTGLGATEVGKLAFISSSGTPANVGAYAMILKDETGGKVRVSPFGTYTPTTGAFVQVTPQVNDVIEIRTPSSLLVGGIDAYAVCADNGIGSGGARVLFDSLTVDGGSTLNGAITSTRAAVLYARSILQNLTLVDVGNTRGHNLRGGGIAGLGVVIRGGTTTLSQVGCLASLTVRAGTATVITDTYFQNSSLSINVGSSASTSGAAFFDRVTSNSSLVVAAGASCVHAGATPDWGTGNAGHGIVVQSASSYAYGTKPTINSGLGAGREAQVGGTDKLYSAIPYVETTNNAALVLTQ
jgi:hypothetical protein